MKEIKLIVANEKLKADKAKGIVRIDQKSAKEINVNVGDIVEIIGKKRTFAKVRAGYREDNNKGIVRIDRLIREDTGLAEGDYALVRSVELKDAQKILIGPIDMRLNVDQDFVDFVKSRMMRRAFMEWDKVRIPILGTFIPFEIIRTLPRGVPVQLTDDTFLSILNEPYRVKRERPFDINFLLRFEWLNNLATRIRATKTVFSIPGTPIRDEIEEKVIDAARKIAEDNFRNVPIEVSFESKRTPLGTLPWVEVDVLGNVSSIRPEIKLPPPIPTFKSYDVRGRVITPMSRCFKTGIRNCPKEINFTPKKIVVAMPFGNEFQDLYRYAIRPALEDSGFVPWKADEHISNIDIMCKICHAIQESGYLLADITTWNANVVFELGLAYGLGKNAVLIKREKAEVPVDLKGIEYIGYGSIDDLKRNLLLFIKGVSLVE